MLNSKSIQTRVILIAGLSLVLTLIGSLMVWPASQVQAGATLPSRPVPVTDRHDDDDDDSSPVGAYIELQAGVSFGGQWSQVEWQDSDGGWQPVEGWAGLLDSQGQLRWWVDTKDFGTGPFRWVVYQSVGGPVSHTSPSFSLPTEAHQIMMIDQ